MGYWIINHLFDSYTEHPDIIGLPVKMDKISREVKRDRSGNLIPKYKLTNRIQSNDKFIYYCPLPKQCAIGLFKINQGPGMFADDWNLSIQFQIEPLYPIKPDKVISYYDLVQHLNFFKNTDGSPISPNEAAVRLRGTIKEISAQDFETAEKLLLGTLKIPPVSPSDGEEESENSEDSSATVEPPSSSLDTSLHIQMISTSHELAAEYHCISYLGLSERNRVLDYMMGEDSEEEEEIPLMERLPGWIYSMASPLLADRRIEQIDNIWFFEESPGLHIPFAVFEHEKDGNIRGVMDRMKGLDSTLKSNRRFKSLNPLYIVVAKDEAQAKKYEEKIVNHGDWEPFRKSHLFHIIPYDNFEKRGRSGLNTIITQHLIDISREKE